MRLEEVLAGNDVRVVVKIDQRLGLLPEPTQTVRKAPTMLFTAGLRGRPFAHRQFDRQLFLDRDIQLE